MGEWGSAAGSRGAPSAAAATRPGSRSAALPRPRAQAAAAATSLHRPPCYTGSRRAGRTPRWRLRSPALYTRRSSGRRPAPAEVSSWIRPPSVVRNSAGSHPDVAGHRSAARPPTRWRTTRSAAGGSTPRSTHTTVSAGRPPRPAGLTESPSRSAHAENTRSNCSAAPPWGCWAVTSPVRPAVGTDPTSQPDRRHGCRTFLHAPAGAVPDQACFEPRNP